MRAEGETHDEGSEAGKGLVGPSVVFSMRTYHVAVIGAGIMGSGLTTQFARTGQDVTLVDHRESNLERARDRIREAVAFLDREGLANVAPESILEATRFTTDLAEGVREVDVVLETVSEELEVKHAVFQEVVENAPDEAVLATNTSGLRVSAIAEGVPEAADRVVGCHWWNPPYLLTPVEVVRGEDTADETIRRTTEFVERVERDPILVQRDVPGFVWNRIQFAVLRECMHLVEEGVASLADVDRAVRDGYARRTAVVGPFETVDLSGLSLFETIASELYPHLADDETPSDLFDERLAAGHGGVAEGAGFYEYEEGAEEATRHRDEGLAALRRALGIGHATEGSQG